MNTVDRTHVLEVESADMILRKPDLFLSFLADAIDEEFVFYSLDASGRFAYLSKSAKKVLGLNPIEWVGPPTPRSVEWTAIATNSCFKWNSRYRLLLSRYVANAGFDRAKTPRASWNIGRFEL